MDTIKEYWRTWLWRDAVTKLITINFVVWLVVAGCAMAGWHLYALLGMPGTLSRLPARLWTVLTYMFTHVDFMHMFVNMLWLLLFGQLMVDTQGGFRLGCLYVYGGIAGAAAYTLYNALLPGHYPMMIGASCSVLAVIGASAILMHGWNVRLFVFGQVRLLWLAIVAVILIFVSTVSMDQAVAHAGGLLTGVVYGLLRQRGVDLASASMSLNRALQRRRRVTARPNTNVSVEHSEERQLDMLLDKISRKGYNSLTPSERQLLFNLSQKIKRD